MMPSRVFVDVEDLFIYASLGLRPSGIQRLEFELCRALTVLPEAEDRVFFVRHDARRKSLAVIPWNHVEALFDVMTSASARPAPLPLYRRLWRALFGRLPTALQLPIKALVGRWRQRGAVAATQDSEPSTIPGDILMCLGAPWITADYSSYMEKAVQERGLRFALLIYDMIPVRRPELVVAYHAKTFRTWISSALPLADTFLTISNATAKDVDAYARNAGLTLRAAPAPIPIGTGFKKSGPGWPTCANAFASDRVPAPNSYALMVSTIEVRKNHLLLFRVWRRLLQDMPAESVPTLVFAGRIGWMVSDLMKQLRNCDFLDGKIIHIDSPTDQELEALYDGCLFTLFPSFYEGWGLPVTESLAFGRPCIVSKATSLPEAGGSLARYIDPDNATDAYRVIRETIEDQAGLQAWRERVRCEFKPVEWSESARAVLQALDYSEPGTCRSLREHGETLGGRL